MNNQSTFNNCLEILNDKKNLTKLDIDTKYIEFKKKYPRLFDMLTLNDDIDRNMLKFLCDKADEQNNLNKINTEESKDKQIENDLEVGDFLAQKYIYDKFNINQSDEEKDRIKRQIKDKLKNLN